MKHQSIDRLRPNPSNQIIGLDLLRFFAAYLVMTLHLWGSQVNGRSPFAVLVAGSFSRGFTVSFPSALPQTAFIGSIGVQVFFCISGFVIAYSAIRSKGLLDFAYHRALRILPGLWICTLIAAIVAVATGFYTAQDALLRTVLSSILLPAGPKIDGVVWTLTLEITFYAYVALISPARNPLRLMWLAWSLALISTIYWAVYFAAGCGNYDALMPLCIAYTSALPYKLSSLLLLQHGCFFALGIGVWAIWQHIGSRFSVWAMSTISFLTCCLQLVWTSQYYHINYGQFGAASSPALLLAVWLAACVWMLLSVLFNRFAHKWIGHWCSGIRLLGLATYPLYLVHSFVGGLVVGIVMARGGTLTSAFVAGSSTAIVAALIVALWLEPPLNRSLSKLIFRFMPPRALENIK